MFQYGIEVQTESFLQSSRRALFSFIVYIYLTAVRGEVTAFFTTIDIALYSAFPSYIYDKATVEVVNVYFIAERRGGIQLK